MRNSCVIFFTLLSILTANAQATAGSSPEYQVNAKGIAAKLSANGEIIGVTAGGREMNVSGRTSLDGCTQVGATKAEKLSGGAVEFTRTFRHTASGRTFTVVDRFKPADGSVRWEIEIASEGEPWTTPIATELNYPATPATRFWTAWSDPVWTEDTDTDKHTGKWTYPLVFQPLTNTWWTFGGRNTSADHVVLPLATYAEPVEDFGLSLVFSPEDTLLCNSRLTTTQSGALRFSRPNYRLGGGKPVRFEMDLIAHEADWRGGLRWMTARYPNFFEPPNPRADAMAGCAAYSGDEDPIDVAKFKKMSFRINWKLCDDFPYMGMFIPPVTNADETWEREWQDEPEVADKPHWTSVHRMNDYANYLKTNGFYLLDYFNVAEFGKNMSSGEPSPKPGVPLWENPRAVLATEFPNALLVSGSNVTAYGAWVVDFGDPDYQKFMLEQADRDIRWLPDSAGICIDRTDWLVRNNPHADDGVSWVNGRAVRSLCVSWNDLLSKLGQKMHGSDKAIFASPLYARLDLYRQVDGFYDEFGYDGRAINGTALMGMDKPVMTWNYNESLFRPDPDSFFQRHLLMGAYPTAPYPWNNHCIIPDMTWDDFYVRHSPLLERDTAHRLISTEKYYLAYGPLLDAIRGKKWVLEPHCLEVVSDAAKANLFQVPGGYAVPVCFGGTASFADVIIRNVPGLDTVKYSVLHPGDETAAPLTTTPFKDKDGATQLRVPLLRGCAMVILRK
ncbi:MAG: hypothetical protein ABSA45_03075 [Verrucomicrobiota bacterium]|jgi:hypothetical protein